MTTTLYKPNSPPIKGSVFVFNTSLTSQADTDIFQSNPTLAAGDVKVTKDYGGANNITTLPSVTGTNVIVSLSALEMTSDVVLIEFADITGSQWQSQSIEIRTVDAVLVGATDAPLASAVADAVWDEPNADHVAVGSTGKNLSTGASSDPLTNIVPGTYLSGSAGAALGRIGGGRVITTSIVSPAGDVETIRGDDYYAADARRLDWTDVDANWPDLTGATIKVNIGGVVEFTGSVITPSGSNKKVGLELSAVQSATIPISTRPGHDYSVSAVLSTNHVVTLITTNKPDIANEASKAKWMSIERVVVGI